MQKISISLTNDQARLIEQAFIYLMKAFFLCPDQHVVNPKIFVLPSAFLRHAIPNLIRRKGLLFALLCFYGFETRTQEGVYVKSTQERREPRGRIQGVLPT
jgi:hypothetical protein